MSNKKFKETEEKVMTAAMTESVVLAVNKTFPFMEFPLSISRQADFPIDRKSLWWSKADADNYASTDPTAYIGMPISVHDESAGTVTLYIINQDKQLQEVGKAPALDGKSIELNDAGEIQIKGFKGATAGKVLAVGSDGNIAFVDSQASDVTQIKEQIQTINTTLEGKAAKTHTHNASTDIIEDTEHRFVTDTEKEAWNAKAETSDITAAIAAIPDASTSQKGLMTPAQVQGIETMAQDILQAQEDIESFKDGSGLPVATATQIGVVKIGANITVAPDGTISTHAPYELPSTLPGSMITEDDTHRWTTDKEKANWNDKYTKAEIDNKINTMNTGMDWKESVATFADIATTYPKPADGWTVNVNDTDITYRYTGSAWIAISANSIPKATNEVDGKMSKEDYKLLHDLDAEMDTKAAATHTHAATDVNEDTTHRFTTDEEKAKWNQAATDATYAKTKADSNKSEIDTLAGRVTTLETQVVLMTEEQAKSIINEYITGAFPVE